MTNKEIIDGLKMTMELITFDPSTGETIDPDNLNDLNRTSYDACNGAIKALEGKDANVPSNNILRHPSCKNRTSLGNCDPVGGFCSSVPKDICAKYYVADTNVGDIISRTDAIELVKDVCDAIMSGCKSHYDSEVGDEVYDDILEVDAILKCNKEIRKALKGMPSAKPENLVKESGGLVKDLVNDTISRQMAIDAVAEAYDNDELFEGYEYRLEALPPAQPETAKRIVGKSRDGMTLWYQCDMCNEPVDAQDDFCRGCGRRLIDE